MSRADAQLERLRDPAFTRLWDRVRQRLEREPDALASGLVRLTSPTAEERQALGGLLGRRFTGRSLPVRLADLDAVLRAGPHGLGVVEVLAILGGPLRDRQAEARRERQRLDDLEAGLRADPLTMDPWYDAWITELRTSGLLTRLVRQDCTDRLERVLTVLRGLPAQDQPVALLAAECFGDAHALDRTPLERLVLHALARWAGERRPGSAAGVRRLWAHFGVVRDDLASQVLVLGLRQAGGGLLGRWLREAAAEGVPFRITLHQLVRSPPTFGSGEVWVCENPSVLRVAAERLGAACPALICTEGRPSVVAQRLVGMLAAGGATVRCHADFDAAGVGIVGDLVTRYGAVPWCFDAEAYRQGLARLADPEPFEGVVPATPWDPTLAEALRAHRVRVEEEVVLERLLTDLGSGSPTGMMGHDRA